MNIFLTAPEIAVTALGLGLLLLDLWTPREQKPALGLVAMAVLGLVLVGTFLVDGEPARYAFGQIYVCDELALFFKRCFLVAAIAVLQISMNQLRFLAIGVAEYFVLVLFALAGMMWAASANDFSMLFVSVELITITFYVLTSYQRTNALSLEAGIKYLILGALASAFFVYGIAFIFGASGSLSFQEIRRVGAGGGSSLLQLGVVLVLIGLGFKIAAFPFQVWAPDVYQGAPVPTVAFLAMGSKAAGFVLVIRVLYQVAPGLVAHWKPLLIVVTAATILYANLCAIPQRNLKRLMGYSSVANAGYLLLGIASWTTGGLNALLFYLLAYLFAVMGIFLVLACLPTPDGQFDFRSLAGLHRRSPLLAAVLLAALASLAGIPPLAGFFGKFLLLKSLVEVSGTHPGYPWLLGLALVGVVISVYYYFGMVRAVFWSAEAEPGETVRLDFRQKCFVYFCLAGNLILGLMPDWFLGWADQAVKSLHFV